MRTSRQIFFRSYLLIFLFAVTFSYTQNLLNNPESVVFDPYHNRYLVSNWADGDGRIVQIDSNGIQSYFSTTLAGKFKIAGLYMFHDTLLAASGVAQNAGLSAFDLNTGDTLYHIVLPEVGLPNDITSDSNGIIYVTDYWDNKLYKIDNHVPSVFISSNLTNPNGIYYDEQNHSLLILSVTGSNSPILAVDPEDAAISTVVYTGFPGLDGITMDNDRNFYISTWGTDAVYKYGPEFNNPPELFSSGHIDPADIYFDKWNNILAVPNFSDNSVDFVPVISTGIENAEDVVPDQLKILQSYPNPFHQSTTIKYQIFKESKIVLKIYDLFGVEVKTLMDGIQAVGEYSVIWDGKNAGGNRLSPGLYTIVISTKNQITEKKLVKL